MGLAATATECSPWANPGKQGLEAAPSPTCRGHLESGPGTGTSDKNVARALNKGSQRGQPGRPHNSHCPRSKTGAQEGAGRTRRQARAARGLSTQQRRDRGVALRAELAPHPHSVGPRGPKSSDSSKSQKRLRVGGGHHTKAPQPGRARAGVVHTGISALLTTLQAS